MNNQLVLLKIKSRLNKLDTDDNNNIPAWQIAEAFNKVQREWVRSALRGYNQTKAGREETEYTQADLEQLLTSAPGSFSDNGLYWSSLSPSDCLVISRIDAYATGNCCPPRPLKVYPGNESDVNVDLMDIGGRQPSWSYAETFYTLFGGSVRIYTNSFFGITNTLINYYRNPANLVFAGSTDPETGALSTIDISCEFRDEIVEIFISKAASLLGGDLENQFQFQRGEQEAVKNT